MAKIGAGWIKFKEDGSSYISLKINEELLPLVITKDQILTLFEIPTSERTKETSPAYSIAISVPKEK